MTSHPCAGHACDHCYLCDVVGICCQTVHGGTAAVTGCCPDTAARLAEAIVIESRTTVSLPALVRAEARQADRPLALLPPQASLLSIESRVKEVEHEAVARPPR